MSAAPIDERLRARLVAVADGLVPAVDGMPAPSAADVGGGGLDAVLAARPELAPGLRRALEAVAADVDAVAWVEALRRDDPEAYEALTVAVVGGYYLNPEVRRLLGYPGQVPEPVAVDPVPDYAEEGLLERVYARGPIYRPTPPARPGGG